MLLATSELVVPAAAAGQGKFHSVAQSFAQGQLQNAASLGVFGFDLANARKLLLPLSIFSGDYLKMGSISKILPFGSIDCTR